MYRSGDQHVEEQRRWHAALSQSLRELKPPRSLAVTRTHQNPHAFIEIHGYLQAKTSGVPQRCGYLPQHMYRLTKASALCRSMEHTHGGGAFFSPSSSCSRHTVDACRLLIASGRSRAVPQILSPRLVSSGRAGTKRLPKTPTLPAWAMSEIPMQLQQSEQSILLTSSYSPHGGVFRLLEDLFRSSSVDRFYCPGFYPRSYCTNACYRDYPRLSNRSTFYSNSSVHNAYSDLTSSTMPVRISL